MRNFNQNTQSRVFNNVLLIGRIYLTWPTGDLYRFVHLLNRELQSLRISFMYSLDNGRQRCNASHEGTTRHRMLWQKPVMLKGEPHREYHLPRVHSSTCLQISLRESTVENIVFTVDNYQRNLIPLYPCYQESLSFIIFDNMNGLKLRFHDR